MLAKQRAAAWAQACYTAWLKSYTNTTESSESAWAAAVHSAFSTTSKKGLEQHMKQRILRKVCMEPSPTATEQLTAKYLQYTLLANLNHSNHSNASTFTVLPQCQIMKNITMPPLCITDKNTHTHWNKQSKQLPGFLNRTTVVKGQHTHQEIREEYFLLNANI